MKVEKGCRLLWHRSTKQEKQLFIALDSFLSIDAHNFTFDIRSSKFDLTKNYVNEKNKFRKDQ